MASVIEQIPYNEYTANGVATVYPFEFELLQAADLVVSFDGVAQPASIFTLAGVGVQEGGTVTFDTAPTAGVKVLLERRIKLERTTDYQTNGDLRAPVLNLDFKRLWQALQQQGAGQESALRAPFPEVLDQLPQALDRRGLQLLFHPSTGQPFLAAPVSGTAADVLVQLADTTVANKGAGIPGFNPSLNYVARTLGAEAIDRGPSLMSFVTTEAERVAIKTGTSTADHSPLLAAALLISRRVYVPAGSWRMFSTIVVPVSAVIQGAGLATAVTAFGCDAFRIAAGGGFCTIAGMGIFSATAGGAFDPRLYDAIFCEGASGNLANYVTCRDLYLQGWADGINWRYTWNSRADNVTTINTNNGIVVGGQSVNNSVTGCRLVSNSGNASISCSQIGGDVPEGLMVSDTLLASGLYGLLVAGSFLSLHVNNSIFDLITGDAIRATDCKALRVTNSWLYAANCCVRLQALGAPAAQGVSLLGNRMEITNATGRVVEQLGANIGLTVVGNHFKHAGTSNGVYLDGQAACVDANYFENGGSGPGINVNSNVGTHRIGKNSGNATVLGGFGTPEHTEGNWTVTDQSGAGLVITNNAQATYVKNGKEVVCTMDVTFPATASGATARLSLPFPPDTGAAHAGSVGVQQVVTFPVQLSASPAAANFVFWRPVTQGFATNADLTTARFVITFTYRASA